MEAFGSTARAGARRWLRRLPGCCEVCRLWTAGRLCGACVDRFAAPAPRCRRCALHTAPGIDTCGNCLREPPPFVHTACAADYTFPWDRLVAAFKFDERVELATTLADLLLRAAAVAGSPTPDLFVPVPLSTRRLAERGYNQAWELARRLAAARRRPAWAGALERRFEAAPQSTSTRAERLAHLRGAFSVSPRAAARLAGRHLVLVDDVMTTGATAREAAAALVAAGAARVDCWVVARTPA